MYSFAYDIFISSPWMLLRSELSGINRNYYKLYSYIMKIHLLVFRVFYIFYTKRKERIFHIAPETLASKHPYLLHVCMGRTREFYVSVVHYSRESMGRNRKFLVDILIFKFNCSAHSKFIFHFSIWYQSWKETTRANYFMSKLFYEQTILWWRKSPQRNLTRL